MSKEEIIEIFNNLKEYIQNKIDSGEHKIYYNDLGWDVKCVDCITAIDTLLDLYKKQKQELDSVKEIYYTQSEIENKYISKDEIRNKIKKLEELYEKEMKPYQTEFGLNLSLLTKKEKEEVINKRNSLLTQIVTLKEILGE